MKTTEFHGWQNNALLENEHASLVVTLDVGPRIISYAAQGASNILKTYPEQLGGAWENEWLIRGGHRLWVAPEDEQRSYVLDNGPAFVYDSGENWLRVGNASDEQFRIAKTMKIELVPGTSRVLIEHTLTNEGDSVQEMASWGLSVMAPGGTEIIPHPPMGSHPENLLPNRSMVLWPYTDLSDPRYSIGRKFIQLRQDAQSGPTKIGLLHIAGWIGYALNDQLFLKKIHVGQDVTYPDMNSNFQTFTNDEMLEIESLGELRSLHPGESTTHYEEWAIFRTESPLPSGEEAIADWLAPFLDQAF